MKLSKLTAIIFTSALACSLTLTGCNEKNNKAPENAQVVKPTKLQPNNWTCRPENSPLSVRGKNPMRRLQRLEIEGKINDSELFLQLCKDKKLGFYNSAIFNIQDLDRRKALFAQWQKEAGVNPNDY